VSNSKIGSTDGLVAIGCGVAMPARLSSIVRDIDLPGIWVSVDVHFEPTVMRYVLHGMAIERDDPAIELTGTLLRTVPIHELMRSATQQAKVKPLDRGNFKICPAGEFVPTEIESLIQQGPSPQTLEVVARHYRVAEVIGLKPAAYIQRFMGIPYPTVSNWISRAKAAGFFPTAESLSDDRRKLEVTYPDDYVEGVRILSQINETWGSQR